ncbi:MAG: hypothetical protein AAB896_03240 [Patescibacteria group bacterium]
MNETGSGEPKFEVVQPVEGAESTKTPVEQVQPASEAAPGKQTLPATPQLPVALPDIPVATPALPVQDDNVGPPVASPKTSKLPAAEKNLIEKQWVQKAKEIVADTKSDPYRQKTEMSKAKADYIQKRFKKVIKTDDPFDATQGRPEQGRTGDPVTA